MQVIAQGLHIREFLVGLDAAIRSSVFGLPGIVDVHIGVTVIGQSLIDQGGGRGHHLLLGHAQGPAVPRIPAHGRSKADLRAHFQGKLGRCTAFVIGGRKDQRIVPFLGAAAAQNALVRIQDNALREALDSIFHGLVTREGQPENHGRTGAHAKHQRAVVTRRGRGRRRKDIGSADLGLQHFLEAGIRIGYFEPLLRSQGAEIRFFLPGGHRYLLRFVGLHLSGENIRNGNMQGTGSLNGGGQDGFVTAFSRLQRKLREILQAGFAYLGGASVEAARVSVIIHPYGNHILFVPLYPAGIHHIMAASPPLAAVPARFFREGSVLSHAMAIEPGLVGIINGSQIQHDGFHLALFERRRNDHVDAVPAIAVRIIHQRFPGLVKRNLTPGAVVKSRSAPGGVVPLLETAFVKTQGLGRKRQSRQCQAQNGQYSFHRISCYST